MINFFVRLKKLCMPKTARPFDELAPVYDAEEVRPCAESFAEDLKATPEQRKQQTVTVTIEELNAIKLGAIEEFLRRIARFMTMGDWAYEWSFNQDTADRVKKEMGLLDGSEP